MIADQVLPPAAGDVGLSFMKQVSDATAGVSRLEMCIQCGTCGGSCPSADAMDHTPRRLFAMIRAGMSEEVLRSNTPWMCVSCYHCVVRCPQDIHITDVMYTLKAMAEEEKLYPDGKGPGFSHVFMGNVQRFGRSWEIGLTARHYMRHFIPRLPRMAPMGLGLMRRGRTPLMPHRIENRAQLHAILERAKELDGSR